MTDAEMAREGVKSIFRDLSGRRWLKWIFAGDGRLIQQADYLNEVRGLDDDVIEEIKATWSEILTALLGRVRREERELCAGLAAGFCEPEDDCDMVPDRLDLKCDGCRIAAAIRKEAQ